jgi:hypothetical protein
MPGPVTLQFFLFANLWAGLMLYAVTRALLQ